MSGAYNWGDVYVGVLITGRRICGGPYNWGTNINHKGRSMISIAVFCLQNLIWLL